MSEILNTKYFGDANIVSYWRMEGNSNDSRGSNGGTDTAITYNNNNGRFSQGAGCNGTSSIIQKAVPVGLPVNADARTVVMWVNCNAGTANYKMFFGYGEEATTRARWTMGLTNGNPGNWSLFTQGDDYNSATAIVLNTWNHYAVVYDGNVTATFYVNGKIDGTKTFASALVTNITNGLSIGADQANNNFFPGNIDDVAIFSRALTTAEIQEIYKEQLGDYAYFM